MRRVRLTFITTIPDAETDDQAYLMADQEVAEVNPPGNWEFDGMVVESTKTLHRMEQRVDGQINLYDYDPDSGELLRHRSIPPRIKGSG